MAQALERAGRTPDVIRTQEEYAAASSRWRESFNLLTPFKSITGLAQQHGIIATQIAINPDAKRGGPGEVYDGLPFLKGDEVALSKLGLRKLAEGQGMSTDAIELRAEISRQIGYYLWQYKGIVTYRGIDGSTIMRTATATWDLSDGSQRLKGWTKAQIEEARKHGPRACETRAINAAIRESGCGIKQAYSRAELARPFLAIRVMFQPDMSDPATRRLVTEHALRGTSALYPAPSHTPTSTAPDVVEHHYEAPRLVGPAVPPPDDVGPPPMHATPAGETSDARPTEGAVKVAKVETKSKTKEGAKRPTVWYLVVDSLGVERSTFDTKIADAARAFEAEGAWVEIDEERSGDFLNIIGIQRAAAGLDFEGALE